MSGYILPYGNEEGITVRKCDEGNMQFQPSYTVARSQSQSQSGVAPSKTPLQTYASILSGSRTPVVQGRQCHQS
jgi:hypothetical protein